MRQMFGKWIGWTAPLALALASAGCVAAAAAAAGAAGGVYLTSQGAESVIDAPVAQVADRARIVMQQFDIRATGTSMNGDGSERELKGERGDVEVTIDIEAQSDTTTRLEVTARRNVVNYDKDFAREIVERIVALR